MYSAQSGVGQPAQAGHQYSEPLFPRHHLTDQEKILWEGRPSMSVYLIKPIIFLILAIVYVLFIYWSIERMIYLATFSSTSDGSGAAVGAFMTQTVVVAIVMWSLMSYFGGAWGALGSLTSGIGAGLYFLFGMSALSRTDVNSLYQFTTVVNNTLALVSLYILFAIIALVFAWLQWRVTFFAISDRRVMTQYGLFTVKFADCGHDKIQTSSIVEPMFERIFGVGTIIFATAGTSGGIKTSAAEKMMSEGGAVIWRAVASPTQTYRYAQEIFESAKKKMKLAEYQMMADAMKRQEVPMGQPGYQHPVGAPIPPPPQQMPCPNCKAPQNVGAPFCSNCGTKLR